MRIMVLILYKIVQKYGFNYTRSLNILSTVFFFYPYIDVQRACVLWGDPNVIQSNPKTVAFKFSYPCKKQRHQTTI
jgi:hypothetical protein